MTTLTPQARNAVTLTPQSRSTINTLATAGLYYGFGAFTYSGNQTLTTTPIVLTAQTRNSVTLTPQTRH